MGNCGVGFAPVEPGKEEWLIQLMEGVEDIPGSALSEGIQWEWESFPEYLDSLEKKRTAIDFGAEGIGLCRTEHMFFEADRILAVREMILAKDTEGRRSALARILPMQRQDFVNLFKIMSGFPVTIRLLDPPLHEFLPKSDDELAQLSATTGTSLEELRHRANQLHEYNPMLGHRGCRLGISHPEIYEMQALSLIHI